MPKLTLSALLSPRPGACLPDPAVEGLRYRVRAGGRTYAELLYKGADGRWTSIALGRVNVQDRLEDLLDAAHPFDERPPQPSLADVLEPLRALAKDKRRELRAGKDPRRADSLAPALAAYERDLERRQVVKRGEVLSLLRRELLAPFGDNTPLDALTHAKLVQRFRAVEEMPASGFPSGLPGAARELRTRTNVFLAWAKDEGLMAVNVLAGSRRQRRTRAERLEAHGRALADWELPLFWRACEQNKPPLGAYLQLRLLCGQRRSETAAMLWQDVDLAAGVWTVPAAGQKSAKVHHVPLPRLAREILARQQPDPRKLSGLVFPGRGGVAMSGWSKTLQPRLCRDRRRWHGALAARRPAQDAAHRPDRAGRSRRGGRADAFARPAG